MKQIELIVMPSGQSRIVTRGFSGGDCREASRFLEQALGQSSGEQLTAGFYQVEAREQRQRELH